MQNTLLISRGLKSWIRYESDAGASIRLTIIAIEESVRHDTQHAVSHSAIGFPVRISFPRLIRVCDQLCNPLILPLSLLSSKASSVDRDQAPDRTTFNFDDFLK